MNYKRTLIVFVRDSADSNWKEDSKQTETSVVDEDFVRKFTSKETMRFFKNLGGYERCFKKANGGKKCTSIDPSKTIKKVTTFEPILK